MAAARPVTSGGLRDLAGKLEIELPQAQSRATHDSRNVGFSRYEYKLVFVARAPRSSMPAGGRKHAALLCNRGRLWEFWYRASTVARASFDLAAIEIDGERFARFGRDGDLA